MGLLSGGSDHECDLELLDEQYEVEEFHTLGDTVCIEYTYHTHEQCTGEYCLQHEFTSETRIRRIDPEEIPEIDDEIVPEVFE